MPKKHPAVELPSPHTAAFIRQRAGVTQHSLARLLAVAQSTLAGWETGARSPAGTNRKRYASVLTRLADELARREVKS